MKRLPDSRVRSTEALKNAARPFIDHSVQGLKTATSVEVIYPSAVARDRKTLLATGPRALTTTKPISEWTPHGLDCLHCADALGEHAVPVVKFKQDGRFWVFGQFCSPSCGLGYLREHNESPQIVAWTLQMFRSVFQISTHGIPVRPPRFMLKRFGGSLDKEPWEREDFICTKSAPLATFSMFAEVEAGPKNDSGSTSLRNLSRPVERDTLPARPTPTGREPVLLRVLAEDTDIKTAAPRSPKRARSTVSNKRKGPTSLSAFFNEDA
jgi:hypothetical protein